MGKTAAIILAGGEGKRFGEGKAKQFAKIAGKTIIEHTIDKFEKHPLIDEIYLVINSNYYDLAMEIIKKNSYQKIKKVLYGGATRQESSRIGVYALTNSVDKVLIHDAVRPFISQHIITEIIKSLDTYSAIDVAVPTADTIIKVDDENYITEIPDRRYLLRGQTPQGFRKEIITEAHKLASKEGFTHATDDCTLVVKYHLCKVYVIKGEELNIKVTYPHDVYIADRVFQLKKLNLLEITDSTRLKSVLEKLANKTIVIFGGTSGIGKEIYKIAKNFGSSVYAFSRKNGVDVTQYQSIQESLQRVYEKHGKIDIVINTAGILKMSPIYTTSLEDIEEQIRVNLLGSIYVSKASIRYLRKSKGSILLFTSSSYTRGRENYSPYSSSKAGVVNFAQALADETRDWGIRVNAICPERTDTPMRRKNFGLEPKHTLLNPKSVAYVSLLVALSDITGQVIDVRKKDEITLERILGKIS